MNYTNGFDIDTILPALKGRIGWISGTGILRLFSSFHALCTETNLKDIQPTEAISNNDFTAYKDTLEDQVIQRCLSSVFSKPEYIEQVLLHTRVWNSPLQTLSNSNLFCGVQFKVAKDFGISAWIKNVTLLFDTNTTFNLYLYKLGAPAPIKTISVTTVANVPTTVSLTNVVLNYAKDQAAIYFLGYFQSDLGTIKAVREQVSMNYTKCFSATYFQAAVTGALKINQAQVAWNNVPYGITAEVHSFRDFTQKIIRSAHLFDEVIGLSMAYYLLEMIVSTTRSNARERILKGAYDAIEIKHYLYGAIPAQGVSKMTGLNDVIARKFEQVRETFYPRPKAQTVNIYESYESQPRWY